MFKEILRTLVENGDITKEQADRLWETTEKDFAQEDPYWTEDSLSSNSH